MASSEAIEFVKSDVATLLSFANSNDESKAKWQTIMKEDHAQAKGEAFLNLAREYPPWRRLKSEDSFVLVAGLHVSEDKENKVCCYFLNEKGITYKVVEFEELKQFEDTDDEENWNKLYQRMTKKEEKEEIEI